MCARVCVGVGDASVTACVPCVPTSVYCVNVCVCGGGVGV